MRYMGTTKMSPGAPMVAGILIATILTAPMSANADDSGSGGVLEADSLVLSHAAFGESALSGATFTDPPTCPDDGTVVVGQAPELEYWVAAFSDVGGQYVDSLARYDNFISTERVTGIRFWGLSLWYDRPNQYWVQCTENPMPFDIRFYADDDGEPGDEVCSYWDSVPGTVVGSLEGLPFDVYEYVVEFEQPCVLRDGWVSIVGEGADDCWFMWLASYEGDGRSWKPTHPCGRRGYEGFDLSLCLTTDGVPSYGACCDDLAGDCQEDVELSECAGRFLHNGTCNELDPPCDAFVGPCCYWDGTCSMTTFEACQAARAGDLDCSGTVDVADIDRFVEALHGEDSWSYPHCRWRNADCNGDGTVDFDDIDPFVTLLNSEGGQPTGTWLGADPWCSHCPPRPIVLPLNLPYADTNSTCGRGNNHEGTCLYGFDHGEDVVYELIVTNGPIEVEIALNQAGPANSMLLDDEYPPGDTCLATSVGVDDGAHSLGCVTLDAGRYYVLVDQYRPCTYEFDLTIEQCTIPTGRCCYGDPPVCTEVAELTCDQLGGTWDESLDCSTPCPGREGEDCGHATLIADVPYQATFYTNEMTADGPGGSCDKYAGGPMPNDAWFVWTAPADGLATATVQAEGHETIIVVRDNCEDQTELHCSDGDDYDQGLGETLSFVVTGGSTYYLQIGDPGTNSIGGWTQLDLDLATGAGACCFVDGTCQELGAVDCDNQGGDYQGDGTTCAGANCPQPTPGDNCDNPIAVTIPGVLYDQNWTVGRGNDYADTCLVSYDSGEDIIYELTVTETSAVSITLDPNGTQYTGVLLTAGCPTDGDCIAFSTSAYGDPHTIDCVVLVPGVYYVMVDKWLAPSGIPDFDLFIDDCTPMYAGACCVGGECVATNWQVECQMLGGSWFSHESCPDFTCQDAQGDTCADPIVVNLPADMPYFHDAHHHYFGDVYNGVTCLENDGGMEVVYELVVTDVTVCLDIVVCYRGQMAIAETCPPTEACIFDYPKIASLELEPGVYYLMVDTGSPSYDYGFHLTIETCRETP